MVGFFPQTAFFHYQKKNEQHHKYNLFSVLWLLQQSRDISVPHM